MEQLSFLGPPSLFSLFCLSDTHTNTHAHFKPSLCLSLSVSLSISLYLPLSLCSVSLPPSLIDSHSHQPSDFYTHTSGQFTGPNIDKSREKSPRDGPRKSPESCSLVVFAGQKFSLQLYFVIPLITIIVFFCYL